MDWWQWWGLFASAYVSSTFFPGGSEVALLVLSTTYPDERLGLWWVATSGNTLGAMTMWYLGWLTSRRFGHDRLRNPHYQRAIEKLRRYGVPVLLLSWMPIMGDPLCFAAGWLRMPLLLGSLLIALGKGFRFAAVIAFS